MLSPAPPHLPFPAISLPAVSVAAIADAVATAAVAAPTAIAQTSWPLPLLRVTWDHNLAQSHFGKYVVFVQCCNGFCILSQVSKMFCKFLHTLASFCILSNGLCIL